MSAAAPAMRRRWTHGTAWWASPLPWLGGLLVVYLLSPIGAFLGRLATADHAELSSPGTGAALAVSAQTATIATAVIAAVGIPLAYALAHGRSRSSAAVGVAVQLPIALPPLMSGILLIYLVGPSTALGRLFDGRLTDDRIGIVLAQVFVAAPFLVVTARSAFAALDPALDDVAATLGHGRWARFRKVAVPAAAPGIVAGLLLAWLRAFGEFGATVILAYHPYSLPVFTYVQFGSTGLTTTLLPVAAALGASAAVLVVSGIVAGRWPRRGSAAGLPEPRAPATVAEPLSFELSGRLGGFDLRLAHSGAGRSLAILGPTGAGKSMTLRLLAGLLAPTGGGVTLGATDLTPLPAPRRDVGYLPQDSSLLPHLAVSRQVGFGATTDPAVAAYWIDRLRLADLVDRRPDELSGGQRRKVALARALAREPRLLLLDEPFSGMDTPVRRELRHDLRRLRRETPMTVVFVTHDVEDAVLLADELLVLVRGRVLQHGPVAEVRASPRSVEVARLLGVPNVFPAEVGDGRRLHVGGGLALPAPTGAGSAGSRVMCRVEPASLRLGAGEAAGTVLDVVDHGTHREVELSVAGCRLLAGGPADAVAPAVGDVVPVEISPEGVTAWPR